MYTTNIRRYSREAIADHSSDEVMSTIHRTESALKNQNCSPQLQFGSPRPRTPMIMTPELIQNLQSMDINLILICGKIHGHHGVNNFQFSQSYASLYLVPYMSIKMWIHRSMKGAHLLSDNSSVQCFNFCYCNAQTLQASWFILHVAKLALAKETHQTQKCQFHFIKST